MEKSEQEECQQLEKQLAELKTELGVLTSKCVVSENFCNYLFVFRKKAREGYMKELHMYNDAKDMAQALLGYLGTQTKFMAGKRGKFTDTKKRGIIPVLAPTTHLLERSIYRVSRV